MTFQFIHAADIHLDSPLRGLDRYEGAPVDEIRLASREAFINLVQLAVEKQVAFVVIAGDLFDGDWKDYNTGRFFAKQMSRLREANIPVYVLKGNHDAANKLTRSIVLPENVNVFSHTKPQTFRVPNCDAVVHGQSFSTAAVTSNLVPNYPRAEPGLFNIGVLHTSATGRDGHENYAPCSLDDLISKGYDYWALGHVHKREVLNAANPLIVFPGNIQGRHAREIGPKGCSLVTVDDRLTVTESFEELCVLQWHHLVVPCETAQSEAEVFSILQSQLSDLRSVASGKPLAVRVELTGASVVNSALRSNAEHFINQIRAIAADAGGDEIWIEKVKVRTSPPVTAIPISHDGAVGELISLIDEYRDGVADMTALRAELSDLDKKLPPEVKAAAGWSDDEFIDEALKDVQQILLSRLGQKV
jgi:exonuclease SbcD